MKNELDVRVWSEDLALHEPEREIERNLSASVESIVSASF